MDDDELLRRELHAAREELIRNRSGPERGPAESTSRLPLLPDRDDEFQRLALMSIDDLETHVERLERDLADLEDGIERLEE